MIKIICGKTGEGKTLECIREIEKNKNADKIGVYSEDCDFKLMLSEVGNTEALKSKDIKIYGKNSIAEDVLDDGNKFDMIVLDMTRDWEELFCDIKKSKCKLIVITQQLNLGY